MLSRTELLQKITKASRVMSKSAKFQADTRFWTPTIDKEGNGAAKFRFVQFEEEIPYAEYHEHVFRGPSNKMYWERCLVDLPGSKCPVCEMNTRLWKSSSDGSSSRNQASAQKRKLKYVSCIYVINDPDNPESNGKTFFYTYGIQIFKKIYEMMEPTETKLGSAEPINPFSLTEGRDFNLIIRNQGVQFRSYSESGFDLNSKELTPEVIASIKENRLDVDEFANASNYKSYTECLDKLNSILEIQTQNLDSNSIPEKMHSPVSKTEASDVFTEDDDSSDTDAMINKFAELAKKTKEEAGEERPF